MAAPESKSLKYLNNVNTKRISVVDIPPLPTSPVYYVLNFYKALIRIYPNSPQFAMNVVFTLMPNNIREIKRYNVRPEAFAKYVNLTLGVQGVTKKTYKNSAGARMPYTFDQIIRAKDYNMYDSDVIEGWNHDDQIFYKNNQADSMHAFLETNSPEFKITVRRGTW